MQFSLGHYHMPENSQRQSQTTHNLHRSFVVEHPHGQYTFYLLYRTKMAQCVSLNHYYLSLYWDYQTKNDVHCLFFSLLVFATQTQWQEFQRRICLYGTSICTTLGWHVLPMTVSNSPVNWGNWRNIDRLIG